MMAEKVGIITPDTENKYGVACMVCDSFIPTEYPYFAPMICDKCKAAIMAMREQMEKEGEENAADRC